MGRSPRRSRAMPEDDSAQPTERIYVSGRRARTLGAALLITLAAAVVPGSGHLVLRRRSGWYILAGFLALAVLAAVTALWVPRAELAGYVLSSNMLGVLMVGSVIVAGFWLATVLYTYLQARPHRLEASQRFAGAFVVTMLCAGVVAPFGFAAYTANAQRNLLNALFPSGALSAHGPAGDVEAIKKDRINIFLVGSDAGDGRIGTRTDTMVVASIDTSSGRTTLFSLPRNLAHAPFPPGSAMATEFPNGFGDRRDPASGFLNGVYAYGTDHPDQAPGEPSHNPGLNLLMSTVSHIVGLTLDFYIQVNMNGFASIIDALGGLEVNVGPDPVPMGGIGPFGEEIKPFDWIPAGQQHLTGDQALWFARSRKNSSDYVRMGRQRCLLQYLIDQKSPVDVLKNFQAVASATKDSVSTNIPQQLLPALLQLAEKARSRSMDSVAFDPNMPDPDEPDGRFNTGNPDYDYVREVVQDIIDEADEAERAEQSQPSSTTKQPPAVAKPPAGSGAPTEPSTAQDSPLLAGSTPAPTSLGEVCGANAPTTH